MAKRWTAEEDEFIKANFGKLTSKEISKALKRDRCVVLRKAKALGFNTSRKPRIPESITSQILLMIKNGYTVDEIANGCFVSTMTVRRLAKKHNLILKRKKREYKKKESIVLTMQKEKPIPGNKPKISECKKRKINAWKKEVRRKWSHICWNCSHATNRPIGYCSWTDHLEPVEGWTAKVVGTRNEYHKVDGVQYITTVEKLDVIKCPLYEDEAFRKISKLKDENFVKAFDIAVALKQRED